MDGRKCLPAELVSTFVLRFPHVLVHALTLDPFVGEMVSTVSGGKLQSVQPITDVGTALRNQLELERYLRTFFGALVRPRLIAANDRVFAASTDDPTVRKLISIDRRPNMAVVKRGEAEIVFLASEDTADVNDEVGREPLCDYFSRLIPHAMALRNIFGEECWHPC